MIKIALLVLMFLMGSGQAENLIQNGNFEQLSGDGMSPLHWRKSSYKNGDGIVKAAAPDTEETGKVLQIQQNSATGWIGCDQVINLKRPLAADCQAVVTFRVSAFELKNGSLILTAGTAREKNKKWYALRYFKGSFDWKLLTKKVTVEKGTTRLCISVRANRPGGMLLVDDVSLMLENKTAEKETDLVRNGRLLGQCSDLTDLPEGWKMKYYSGLEAVGHGRVIQGDKQDNILHLQWISGARRFGAEALLRPMESVASQYRVSAEVKCSNGGQALFAVEMYDVKGKKIDEIFSVPESPREWTPMVFNIFCLPGTVNLRLYCLSGNTGSVQFRRVSCLTQTGKTTSSLPLDAKILPIAGNRIWNGGKNEFTSFLEAPLPLTFHFKGRKNHLRKPELVVEMPSELRLADSYCMHFVHYGKEQPLVQKVNRQEGSYVRYIFRGIRPFKILQPTYGWSRKLTLAIAPADSRVKSGRYRIFWHLRDETRQNREQFFDFILRHWPKNQSSLPDFPIYRWGCEDHLFSSDKIANQVAAVFEQCNLNAENYYYPDFTRGREINDCLKKRGWRHYRTLGNFNYVRNLTSEQREYLKNNLEYSVSASGMDKKRLCPTYITDSPVFYQAFEDGLRKRIASLKMTAGEIIMLDIEPWSPLTRCFCNRCRQKFAGYIGQKKIPSIAEIRKNHHAQWIQFRCENTAEQIAMHRRVIKQYFPDLKLADYDYIVDFSKPDYKKSYYAVAKDPELSEQYFDMHMASYYHVIDKEAFEMIRINSRRLKKNYMPVCAIDEPGGYLTAAEILSPEQVRLMLIGAAVNGCAGFAVYPGLHLDGTYLLAFRRALQDLAPWMHLFQYCRNDIRNVRAEPRPFSTREIQVDGQKRVFAMPRWKSYFASHAFAAEEKTVVVLLNYHQQYPLFADVRAEMKDGSYAVILNETGRKRLAAPSGKAFWSSTELRQGIPIRIGCRDVRFVMIRPWQNQDMKLQEAQTVDKVEEEFRKAVNSWGGKSRFVPRKSGSLSVDLTDWNGDGELELQLRTSNQTVCLDYRHGGSIHFWQIGTRKSEAVLSVDKLWMPRNLRGELTAEAAIVKAEIEDDAILVQLEKKHAGSPLKILRTYQLKDRQNGIQLTWKVTNTGSGNISFCWWNAARFPGIAGKQTLFQHQTDGKWVNLQLPESGSLYLAIKNAALAGIPARAKQLADIPTAAFSDGRRLEFQHDDRTLMSYYYWRSPSLNTWEWMYQPVTLKPGNSHIFHQTVFFTENLK